MLYNRIAESEPVQAVWYRVVFSNGGIICIKRTQLPLDTMAPISLKTYSNAFHE